MWQCWKTQDLKMCGVARFEMAIRRRNYLNLMFLRDGLANIGGSLQMRPRDPIMYNPWMIRWSPEARHMATSRWRQPDFLNTIKRAIALITMMVIASQAHGYQTWHCWSDNLVGRMSAIDCSYASSTGGCRNPEIKLTGNRETETGTVMVQDRPPVDTLFQECGLNNCWFWPKPMRGELPERTHAIIMETNGTAFHAPVPGEISESGIENFAEELLHTLQVFHCVKPNN